MAERRGKLLEAGLELFGATGYAKTGIKGICNLAGLTERYFYESFKNKEEFLICVYNRVVDELAAMIKEVVNGPGSDSLGVLSEALRRYYGAFLADPRKARILFFEVLGVSPEVDRQYRKATSLMADMISAAVCRGFPEIDKKDLDASIIPTGLTGAVNLIAERWVLDGFKTPLDEIVDQAAFLVESFDSFFRQKGP